MANCVKQAVILAGGRGTRLRPFTDTHPKPLYPVEGVPFINRLVLQVKTFGIENVVVLLGYLADQIIEELGDGRKFGLQIQYDITPEEYDTGERMMHAVSLLEERFLLMYCDNYCPVDFPQLVRDSFTNNAMVQLSAYRNRDHYTKDNLRVSNMENKVLVYDKTRTKDGLAGVDIGYAIVRKEAVMQMDISVGNFAASLYPKLVRERKLYATLTEHRYYSIGSYDRLALTREFFRPKRVVFLDRDGTLNVRPPKACYIERPSDFHWIPGAVEAVRMLTDRGVMTILITNQPGIARRNLTILDLNAIHEKMQHDLENAGTRIDHIYYCPHDWGDGCDCRKPNPGMLYQAQKELSLNLAECVLFGDDERDIQAGQAAGCESVLVSDSYPLIEAVREYCRKME